MAQAQSITYYNQEWEETSKEQALYYRQTTPPTPPDTLIHIQDFYIDGTRQSDGYVTTLKYDDNYVGRVNWYYPNGQLEHFTTYHPETLKKFGPTAWYLKNGELLAKGEYKYGSAFNGIVRNHTYALRFTKVKNGHLISRLDFYDNSHQISHEQFYFSDNFRIKEDIYYDKKGQELGRLKYLEESGMRIDSGIKIKFYRADYTDLSVKTTQHYQNQQANGEQITYHPDGRIWTKGINKNNQHFDGEFIDYHTYTLVQQGNIIKTIQYDKNWKIKATLRYKNNNIWEGTDEGAIATDIYKAGKRTQRTTYFTPNKEKIKSRKTYKKDIYEIEWFDKTGKKLGTGVYKENEIWEGLDIRYAINTTLFSHFKAGKKEGVEKLFDDQRVLLSEKTYHNGLVIFDKTRNPLTGKMVDCIYKNGSAFDGRFFEYDEESLFKNGALIQKNDYTKNNGQLSLKKSTFYNSKKQISKVTVFENTKAYTLFYKDDRKDHGIDKTKSAKITYSDEKKNGPFEYYQDSIVIVSGTLKNGLKDGLITFFSPSDNKLFTCEYKEGSPFEGTAITDSWGDYAITHFKNGKRNGQRILYRSDDTITENYNNGVLDGHTSWVLKDGRTINGSYQNGKPFNGDFYDPEFDIAESYIQGKKHGPHKSHLDGLLLISTEYNKGIKTWEQTSYAISDTIFSEGTFKNGQPYNGVFTTPTEHEYQYFTPYKNGQKNGKETLSAIWTEIKELGFTHFKNNKKEGEYLLIAPEFLPKGIEKAQGIYKNNQPYSGTFITNPKFKTISTYQDGLKNGIEISETSESIDTLYFKNGKPINGIKNEAHKKKPNYYFSHKYLNGVKVSSRYDYYYQQFSIVYLPHGFSVRYLYQNTNKNLYSEIARFYFKNKKHTKGSIELFEKSKSIGRLYFKKGHFTKGKIETNDFTIFPKGNLLVAKIHTPTKKYLSRETYTLPKQVSYQDFDVLENAIALLLKNANK